MSDFSKPAKTTAKVVIPPIADYVLSSDESDTPIEVPEPQPLDLPTLPAIFMRLNQSYVLESDHSYQREPSPKRQS